MNKKVLKKDGTLEAFNFDKVRVAVAMSAARIGAEVDEVKFNQLEEEIAKLIHTEIVTVERIHSIVEMTLARISPEVAHSYAGFRNWKKEMATLMETIVASVNKSMSERDRSNSNLVSDLFAAKRTNVSKILLKEMFMKYFLTEKERQAVKDGFIYPHDTDNRLIGTHNCCVAKMENIMDGGFWINGFFCKEPKNITNAVGVLGDIMVSAASAQYGGFSVADIDTTLAKYCEKSFDRWHDLMFSVSGGDGVRASQMAMQLTRDELEDALQALEFQLNTRESARGDYPFVTFSFGADMSIWGKEVSKAVLAVRRKGHGDRIKQKVVFPKLVFRIRHDRKNDKLLDDAIFTSSKALYPDYIDDKVATPMGCRSFLTPDEDGDTHGRGNIGVVTLNLPSIVKNAELNKLDVVEEIIKYVDMVRDIHMRTYELIGKQKAASNPLMFTQGGFKGGHLNPEDEVKSITDTFSASFGITALHELTMLCEGKSLLESKLTANYVIDVIQSRIDHWKEVDGKAYSIYGTPAESLCGTQVRQFRDKFGSIAGVSDRDYFSNSFHCHVSEEINPFEKQDNEVELFHKHTGGHIQYVRIDNPDNLQAMKDIVLRGVLGLGLYQGTNLNACTCNGCGHEGNDFDEKCPVCGSHDYNEFNRICGYLGFTRKNGDWTMNDAKISEVKDRKSM